MKELSPILRHSSLFGLLAVTVLALFAFSSCKKTIAVTSIRLDKTSLTLTEGESANLTATVSPSDATVGTYSWSSSDPSVASVNSGVVKALKAGSATITVTTTDGGKSASCSVTVKSAKVSVTGVTLDKTSLTLTEGDNATLTATVAPSNATDSGIAWSSSDAATASVDNSGKITAVKAGNAIITVTTNDGAKTANCAVTVNKKIINVTGVTLDKTSASLLVGQTQQLKATVSPDNATDKSVSWSSSNPNIASVDNAGLVTAQKPGSATITVVTTDGSKMATCDFTITQPVSGVTLDKSTLTLTEGDNATLTATVSPEDASNKEVSWSTSAAGIVSLDQTGNVLTVKASALKEGSASITVTTKDGGKTATCTVTVNKKFINVESISLDYSELSLFVGKTIRITATIKPDDATNKSITWSSANTGIVSVDGNGNVTAIKGGTATITAVAQNGKSAQCKVNAIQPVTGVKLNSDNLNLIEGDEAALTATVEPYDASNKEVAWSSSDASIATVDQTGKVKAIKAGEAKISVITTDGSFKADCKVTVSKKIVNVKGVSLDKATASLLVGQTQQLTATVTPDNATDKSVTWGSSNPNVASVDQTGLVTAKAKGEATITVTTTDGAKMATCDVTVTMPVSGVSLDKKSVTLVEGGSATITATVEPADASNKEVSWSTSDAGIVTLDQTGNVTSVKVTAVKAGTATITVTTKDGKKTADCVVFVDEKVVPVESVSLDYTTLTIREGETGQLTATVKPDNATDKSLTWSSSSPFTASVDENGLVTAIKTGTASITATSSNGKSAACAVTVKEPAISIPDANFKAYLVKNFDTDHDGEISISEAKAVQTIDCNSLNIKSLEGIQYFTSLKELNCSYNDLYSIDVQSNTNLERLYCYQCKLSSIDVSKNLKLKGLGLSSNSLTDLDVSKNLNLENLECDNNDLSSLDISKNTSLYALYCFHNKIRNLDVSTMANPGAVEIYCGDQHDDSNAAITIELTLTLAQKARWEYCLNDDATQNARVHANYKDHVSVTGVTVSPAAATLVVDQTRQLTATVSPSDATDKSVSWSSSNSSIASVDQNGLVTAVAAGSATITVTTTDGSKMATCNVTVSQPVTSITISQATATILKGASIQLSATVYPDNADDKSVTWSSSATSVATVDQTGYVTGVAAGSATITVKAKNGVSATSVVNVGTPALATDKGIGTKFSAENGSSLRIFVANSADGSEVGVSTSWTTTNDNIVKPQSYTSFGSTVLLFKNVGSVTITATFGSTTLSADIISGVAFDDDNLRNIIIASSAGIDTDGDKVISWDESRAATTISATNREIASTTGISEFVNLTSLNLSGNSLTGTADFSSNPKLTNLNLSSNGYSSINLSGNTKLTDLNVSGNNLTTLDLSKLTSLARLYCSGNHLLTLDLKANTALLTAYVGNQWDSNGDASYITVDRGSLAESVFPGLNEASSGNSRVKWAAVLATGISIVADRTSVIEGQSITCTATVTPSNTTQNTVHWEWTEDYMFTRTSSYDVNPGVFAAGKITDTGNSRKGYLFAQVTANTSIESSRVPVDIYRMRFLRYNAPSNEYTTDSPMGMIVGETAQVCFWGGSGTSLATTSMIAADEISFTNSNSSVASVTKGIISGTSSVGFGIKGLAVGSTTITATIGSVSRSFIVNVSASTISSLSLSSSSFSEYEGQLRDLTCTYSPAAATEEITWTSSNSTVATLKKVSASAGSVNYYVEARATGSATITLKSASGAVSKSLSVTVEGATLYIEGSGSVLSVNRPNGATFSAYYQDADGQVFSNSMFTTYQWSSSNTSVATVTERTESNSMTADIKCVGVGTATITLTLGGGIVTRSFALTSSVGITFKDSNLQSALVADYTVNTNRDSYISYAEAQAATTLNLSNKSISDISDLNSYFTNITSLNVNSNNLTSVPLYNCHKITTLDCSYNKITSLTQIRYMTSLSSLRCNDNYITTLDATTMVNPTSYELYCGSQKNSSNSYILMQLYLTSAQNPRWVDVLSKDQDNYQVTNSIKN